MTITPNLYAKARAEIIALFGWNADSLSPDQTLRLDCAVVLRLALDDLQGRICRGESIDVARMLTASEALARLLPPAVLATPPSEQREDRDAVVAPLLRLFRHLHESVHTLSAENARLKAQLAGGLPGALAGHSTDEANSTPRGLLDGCTGVLTPPTADIVPPGERAECDAGPRAGPDDPPPRSTRIINAKAVKRPNPPAASWDDTPNGRAWQDWHDAQQGGAHYDRWGNHNV
jgi:hypothetical protein